MSYEIDLKSVERRLPKGFRLPESFRRFTAACRGRVDDRDAKTFPYPIPKTANPARGAARTRFETWMKAREPQPETFDAKAADDIRAELVRALSRTRQLTDSLAGATLIATCTAKKYAVDWYDFGLKRCPLAAKLRPALTRLRDGLGRGLEKSEISVWPDGRVFFEKNTELGKARPGR